MATTTWTGLANETFFLQDKLNSCYSALLQERNGPVWTKDYDGRESLASASGIYGPGPVMAWYLMMASGVLNWLFHPRKTPDSLGGDLAFSLSLPMTASMDFIVKARALLNTSDERLALEHPLPARARAQMVAATQEPFDILEGYMLYGAILLVIALSKEYCWPSIAIAMSILFCFTGEWYMHFSGLRAMEGLSLHGDRWTLDSLKRSSPENMPRYASPMGVLVAILPMVFVTVVYIAISAPLRIRQTSIHSRRDKEGHMRPESPGISQEKHFVKMPQWLRSLFQLPLLLSAFMCIGSSMERLRESSYWVASWTIGETFERSLPRLAVDYLSMSVYTMRDINLCSSEYLYQIVAATFGVFVLMSSICSIAKARFNVWKKVTGTKTDDRDGHHVDPTK